MATKKFIELGEMSDADLKAELTQINVQFQGIGQSAYPSQYQKRHRQAPDGNPSQRSSRFVSSTDRQKIKNQITP